MQREICWKISAVLLALALVLGGCSDFDEMKGQRLFIQAETLLEKGEEVAAEAALAELVAQYPATQAAIKGRKMLRDFQLVREKRERMEFSKVLNSYGQVFNGFRAMYAEYPRSMAALDKSDYFFDSSYLEEITPEDYQVYLLLQDDGSGYRIWCVKAEAARGYSLGADGKGLLPFEPVETLARLKARYTADAWDRKIVVLFLQ